MQEVLTENFRAFIWIKNYQQFTENLMNIPKMYEKFARDVFHQIFTEVVFN